MSTLKDKVILVSGGSRGIGLAIALRAAKDGAKVAILGKTAAPDPRLPGTIFTAADEIRQAGGQALAIKCDVTNEAQVKEAIAKTVAEFGGIDILVNNASVLSPTDTEHTEMKRFDLMVACNVRATFMLSKYALPYLKQSKSAHILNMSPPLNIDAGWFAPHVAYTYTKYGMSFCTLAHAQEFKKYGIAVNSLWPETAINTSAVKNLLGGDESVRRAREATIVADAAHWILTQPKETTGQFFIDSEVLKDKCGETDLDKYAVDPTQAKNLLPDYFLGDPAKHPMYEFAAKQAAAQKATSQVQPAPAPAVTTDETPAKAPAKPEPFRVTEGTVAALTFTNPKQFNFLGERFFEELPGIVDKLTKQGTRVLIIDSEGPFSSGIDLGLLGKLADMPHKTEADKKALADLIRKYQLGFRALMDAPFPVIAAVSGICMGAALDLACACDLVYCDPSAVFQIQEINAGLMADLGTLQRLPHLMNAARCSEMAFTGRPIDAKAAEKSGFIASIVAAPDLKEYVRTVADEIAAKAPSAVKATKRALAYNHGHTVAQSMDHAIELQVETLDFALLREAVAKITAKTKRS